MALACDLFEREHKPNQFLSFSEYTLEISQDFERRLLAWGSKTKASDRVIEAPLKGLLRDISCCRKTSQSAYDEHLHRKSGDSPYGDKHKESLRSDGHVDVEVQTSQSAYFECLFRKSRGLLYGHKYQESLPSEDTQGTERKEREEFFANLGSPKELKDLILIMKRVLSFIIAGTSPQSTKTSFEFLNLFVSEDYRLSILDAMNSQDWEKVESLVMPVAAAFLGRTILLRAFIISAVFHLSVVYQYLVGHIDRGGGKTHSSGSSEFRNIYISIVLFLGAYIWIKSRDDVAPPSQEKPSTGIHRKSRVTESGVTEYYGRFEPRFKPSHGKNYISVGSYEDEEDARTMYQIIGFLYGKNVSSELRLPDGSCFIIPPMTEDEQRLNPEEKKKTVKGKAKETYENYKRAMLQFAAQLYQGWIENFGNDQIQDTEYVPPLVERPDANAGFGGMDSSGVQGFDAHAMFQGEAGLGGMDSSGFQGCDALPMFQGDARLGGIDSSGVQRFDAHPTFQGDLQGNVPVSQSSLSPNFGPVTVGVQDHMANGPLSSHIVGSDASQFVRQSRLAGQQHLEPQLQQGSLPETQVNNLAINVNFDDCSHTRQVRDLQEQNELLQFRIGLLGSELLELKGVVEDLRCTNHEVTSQNSLLVSQNSLLVSQNSELKRQQKLDRFRIRQLESQTLELKGEGNSLQRKRTCFGLTSRSHGSQH